MDKGEGWGSSLTFNQRFGFKRKSLNRRWVWLQKREQQVVKAGENKKKKQTNTTKKHTNNSQSHFGAFSNAHPYTCQESPPPPLSHQMPIVPTLSSPGAPGTVRSFPFLFFVWQIERALEPCFLRARARLQAKQNGGRHCGSWRASSSNDFTSSMNFSLVGTVFRRQHRLEKATARFENATVHPSCISGHISWPSLFAVRAEGIDAWWTVWYFKMRWVVWKTYLCNHYYYYESFLWVLLWKSNRPVSDSFVISFRSCVGLYFCCTIWYFPVHVFDRSLLSW